MEPARMDLEAYLSKIRNNRFIPTPGDKEIYTGGKSDDFLQIGVDTLRSLIRHANVNPASKILEIGSGMGRIALPLTQWLEGEGEYVGVEIVKDGVAGMVPEKHRRAIRSFPFPAPRHLQRILQSARKKEDRRPVAAEKHFDTAIFCSVFTHLIDSDVDAYLKLLSKHMASGGLLWGTWFIMDEEARRLVREGKSTLKFILDDSKTFFLDAERKSTVAVAYDPDYVRQLLQSHGFAIEHLDKGLWCQRDLPWGGYQDLIVARLA